jgi:hypothetical protein
MPALDDHIDDLLDTYFYHVTTPDIWEQIKKEGLRSGANGMITALTTNDAVIINHYASQRFDGSDIVVVRFNPCNVGLYPKRKPEVISSQAENFIIEIKANIIGPLLLEKESERRIDHS